MSEESQATKYERLAKHYDVTMECDETAENPHMVGGNPDSMTHWECELSNKNGFTMEVVFSMGSGFNGREPFAAEVLFSLKSDVTMEWDDFSEYLHMIGTPDLSPGHPGYEATQEAFKAMGDHIEQQGQDLAELLGDRYDEFMNAEDGD